MPTGPRALPGPRVRAACRRPSPSPVVDYLDQHLASATATKWGPRGEDLECRAIAVLGGRARRMDERQSAVRYGLRWSENVCSREALLAAPFPYWSAYGRGGADISNASALIRTGWGADATSSSAPATGHETQLPAQARIIYPVTPTYRQ